MSRSAPVSNTTPRDCGAGSAATFGGRQSGPAHPAGRIRHLGWAAALMLTWPIGLALFTVWIVLVCLSPISVLSPLLIPCHAAIRRYTEVHRHWAGRVLGEPILRPRGGKPTSPGLIGRILAALRDPATWREWCWLLAHASAGFALSTIAVSLLGGAIFYLVYPLLYSITPHEVFGTVFGVVEIHSLAQAWMVVPVSVVLFAIWLVSIRGLNTLNARMMRELLGSRHPADHDEGSAMTTDRP